MIWNNIEAYEELVPQTRKIPHCTVKFVASEENTILSGSLNWYKEPKKNFSVPWPPNKTDTD